MVMLIFALDVGDVWSAGRTMDVEKLKEYYHSLTISSPRTEEELFLFAITSYHLAGYYMKENRDSALLIIDRTIDILEKSKIESSDKFAFLSSFYGTRGAILKFPKVIFLSRKAKGYIRRAMEMDSTNPRVWLFLGIMTFYTPGLFGGGPDKAYRYLSRALNLFEKSESIRDRWGEDVAFIYMARILYEKGDTSSAVAILKKALEKYPDFRWAKELLQKYEKRP